MTPANPPNPVPPASGGADPSMEDILASIRRILSEDDADPLPPAHHAEPEPRAGRVLELDPSMIVDEPSHGVLDEPLQPPPEPGPRFDPPPPSPPQAQRRPDPAPVQPPVITMPNAEPPRPNDPLLAPEATAAAANSMGSLLRTLSERQQVAVYRGGPTIEDLVREEIRPLLKQWLDQNLPPLVERLVRTEIERVVGRALS